MGAKAGSVQGARTFDAQHWTMLDGVVSERVERSLLMVRTTKGARLVRLQGFVPAQRAAFKELTRACKQRLGISTNAMRAGI